MSPSRPLPGSSRPSKNSRTSCSISKCIRTSIPSAATPDSRICSIASVSTRIASDRRLRRARTRRLPCGLDGFSAALERVMRKDKAAFAMLQQHAELVPSDWLAVQITLGLIAAELPQRIQLFLRLDTFRDHKHLKGASD